MLCFHLFSLPFSLYPVVVTSGELNRAVGISVRMVAAVRARRWCLVDAADIGTKIASVVFSLTIEKGGAVGSCWQSAVAAWVVKVIGVVRGVVAVAAVHAGVVVVVSARSIVVVHVDSFISLFVMGRHGECGLVRVDVLAAADFAAIIAWQSAMEVVVLQSVCTKECSSYPEKTIMTSS
jgi:hypothetical protein